MNIFTMPRVYMDNLAIDLFKFRYKVEMEER